ncbi:MAG: tRNA (adenosine(37)-N6)-threonylcarbamoyltransferase complex ATPase subunit type 1 TsaE [Alphaproteobacteria bacterium]
MTAAAIWRAHRPLPDIQATEALGETLARHLLPGDVIGLSGELGAGKSVLARAVIRALAGADEIIPSPSFTLAQHYQSPWGVITHFDLYRLTNPGEIFELGFEDAGDGITLVEWPERAGPYLPPAMLTIHLHETDETGRGAVISGAAFWGERLGGIL